MGLFDGIDGIVARHTNQQTDFGGYVDIICDFSIYALYPIGLTYAFPTSLKWLTLSLMEATFFVNAAGLMYLASLLEKRNVGAKLKGEMTSITMPSGLIEGTETMVFFQLFLLFPSFCEVLFGLFGLGVTFTILHRIFWAKNNL